MSKIIDCITFFDNNFMFDFRFDVMKNYVDKFIYADESDAESGSAERLDLLSNGIKIRATHSFINTSGATYIYMAFAENPFVSSTGIPCTAR